jgi:hypothetical protein
MLRYLERARKQIVLKWVYLMAAVKAVVRVVLSVVE